MGDHSSGTALADRLARPTRMEREGAPAPFGAPIPIRSCSRRGLPCHPCHQGRGGLLPHPFTLTFQSALMGRTGRRFAFCGAIPRVAGFPPSRADVIRRLAYVEPGLSSSSHSSLKEWTASDRPAARSNAQYITRRRKGRFRPLLRPKRRTCAITALGYGLFRFVSLEAGGATSGGFRCV